MTKITSTLLPGLQRAADIIQNAEALIITAGAGMAIASGIANSKSPEQFWQRFPPLKKKGVTLQTMCRPHWFQTDPKFAWGFYAHRFNDYKKQRIHPGYDILRSWAERMDYGYFVYTSNVDGRFQRSGLDDDKILECHGSVHYFQCVDTTKSKEIWPVPENTPFEVDTDMLMVSPLPMGPPHINTYLARPNIYMYGDTRWLRRRTDEQQIKLNNFLASLQIKEGSNPYLAVLEIGAGTNIPTVRNFGEYLVKKHNCAFIRINPEEAEILPGDDNISLPLTCLEALPLIDQLINNSPS